MKWLALECGHWAQPEPAPFVPAYWECPVCGEYRTVVDEKQIAQ